MRNRYFTLVKIIEWTAYVVAPIVLAIYMVVRYG